MTATTPIPAEFRSQKVYQSASIIHEALVPFPSGARRGQPTRVRLYQGYASAGYKTDFHARPIAWIELAYRVEPVYKIRCDVFRYTGRRLPDAELDYAMTVQRQLIQEAS